MTDRQPYVSTLENFNLRIEGRWTTVRMEPLIMDALHAIARAESKSIHELCTQVVARRTAGSVTSSLRLAATAYFRERCEAIAGPLARSSSLASEILDYRNLHLETEERYFVARNRMDLTEVYDAHPGLGFLLAYWRVLGSGEPPSTDLDLEPLRRVNFLPFIHIIDVSPSDPGDYRALRQAPVTVIYRRPDNTPLRAFGDSVYVRSLMADYEEVKRTRKPSFQRLSVKSPEGSVRYFRLILAMAREDGAIDRLVVGVSLIAPRARRGTSKP
jgi:predicted DNA-binding ribbon-helix-helix protein